MGQMEPGAEEQADDEPSKLTCQHRQRDPAGGAAVLYGPDILSSDIGALRISHLHFTKEMGDPTAPWSHCSPGGRGLRTPLLGPLPVGPAPLTPEHGSCGNAGFSPPCANTPRFSSGSSQAPTCTPGPLIAVLGAAQEEPALPPEPCWHRPLLAWACALPTGKSRLCPPWH